MKFRLPYLVILLLLPGLHLFSQAENYNGERIAVSFDGNSAPDNAYKWPTGDPDDWGAAAASCAIVAKLGLQDKVVHFSYNNFIDAPSGPDQENQVKISADGAIERWGFDPDRFFDVTTQLSEARTQLAKEIARSTESDPLYFLHAGLTEFLYQAVSEVVQMGDTASLNYLHIISHSGFNENEKRREWHHNLDELFEIAGHRIQYSKIQDQNDKTNPSNLWNSGSDFSVWYWMRDHQDPDVRWMYERLEAHSGQVADISDCGLFFYLLTGDDQGTPAKFESFIGPGVRSLSARELPFGFPDTDREKLCINTGWRFHLGDPDADNFEAKLDDSAWELVSVPHTLKLTSQNLDGVQDDKSQLTFHREVGWYRKSLTVGVDRGQKVFVEFEGAHQVTDLWVNGKHVGQHAVGGYTPFHFDVSEFVEFGSENQLTLLVDNRRRDDVPPDPGPFDYIKFSGLYRDVYLVQTNPLHITFNWEALEAGITITTPSVDPVNMNATIIIKTVVRNESAKSRQCTMVSRVIDDRGVVVMKLEQSALIDAGRDYVFNQVGGIEDGLRLWSIDDPYLYRVNSMVLDGDEPVDVLETRMGVRKVELTKQDGLLLNGVPVKMIGTNRHQHYGYIGDALPNSLHYKDVLQIKKLGMNTLRTAHYPHDDAILDACDELGLLVYEEAPTWISIAGEAWFDNYEKAARAMVRNHRNHPSVIIWGAGINHRGPFPRAQYSVKQEDPTRFTASQGSRWTGAQNSGLTDIYAQMVYGPYYWDQKEYVFAMEGGWGPSAVNEVMDHPMKLGLISWTAHAYYTFHPINTPNDRARLGMMTVFRVPRPGMMWLKSELGKEPFLHIENPWKEGIEELSVFSNADEIQVMVNGKEIARAKPLEGEDYDYLNHPPFKVPVEAFEEGELTVNGLVDGEIIVSESVSTPGKAYKLELLLDMEGRELSADGSDIVVAYAQVLDKDGTLISDADVDVSFSLEGPASVVGDGTDIASNPRYTTYGIAPALIRAGTEPGPIVVKAKAKGLKISTATVNSIQSMDNRVLAEAKAIYDFEKIRVDIGEHNQLLQFDWTPWYGDDNSSSEQLFDALGGFTAELKAVKEQKLLRWLGEINVMGKNAYAFGEGVLCMDQEGLVLEFKGLKKGSYKLTTWHHAPRSGTDSMDPNQELQVTAQIFKLPYAGKLDISATDAKGTQSYATEVTFGKDMHTDLFGSAAFIIKSDGVNPLSIIFTDPEKARGIWLNAFELSEWFED